MKYTATLSIALLLLTISVLGQTIVKMEDNSEATLKNSGVIKDHNKVTGYYFFYQINERRRKERIYYLDLFDEAMNVISKKKIVGSKTLELISSAFNGEYFMFKYLDSKERKVYHKMYNKEAELIDIDTKELSKKEAKRYLSMNNEKANLPEVFAISDKGFISYTYAKNNKNGYEIDFISSKDEKLNWSVVSDINANINKSARLLTFNEDIVISLISNQPTSNSNLTNFQLLANNINSGEKHFKVEIKDKNYTVDLTNGSLLKESGQILLIGEFYPPNSAPSKKSSLGLFTYTMDLSGKIIDRKYHNWNENDKETIAIDEKGKKKKMSIWFHDFIQTEDGGLIAIGEKYRKAIDGTAVAINIFEIILFAFLGDYYYTSTEPMTKIVIDDMLIYKFSSEFELDTTIVIDKYHRDFDQMYGAGSMSAYDVGQYISQMGGFDYAFTQLNKNGANFSVVYMEDKYEDKRYFETVCARINYEDGQIIKYETEMDFYKDSEIINIFPSSDNYILFSEYFYKEKVLENRFLKLEENKKILLEK